MKLQHRNYLKS